MSGDAAMSNANLLATLLLCGLLGLVGQGIRATVGLANSGALQPGKPDQQSEFNAAYLAVTLMIGFIAGILAGFGLGIDKALMPDGSSAKDAVLVLLGIVTAGYAGTDFIENSLSRIMPGLTGPASGQAKPEDAKPAQVQAPPPVPALLLAAPGVAVPTLLPKLVPALRIVATEVNTDRWAPALSLAFTKFEMTSNRRVAAAMGQFLVEAGAGLQEIVEILNYTQADRIAEVFPGTFPNAAAAEAYVGRPEALGNLVYANRLGNGDVASGDGFRFRGRGLIQLTGRDTYTEFGTTIGKTAEDASDYCETAEGAAVSGCWYLASHGCLVLADSWQISKITLRVNGAAMLGAGQRLAYANAMLKALGG